MHRIIIKLHHIVHLCEAHLYAAPTQPKPKCYRLLRILAIPVALFKKKKTKTKPEESAWLKFARLHKTPQIEQIFI